MGDDLPGVSGGGGFGDRAVVEEYLVRGAFEDDAGGGAGVAGNADALGCAEGTGANGYRNVGHGFAFVADLDCDEPAGGLVSLTGEVAWSHAGNAEIGEATIVVDPVVEEPAEIFF